MVKLLERAFRDSFYPLWWVEDIETNERWEEPVSESELGDALTEMEVIAIMTELE